MTSAFDYFLYSFFRRGHDDLGDHYLDCGDLSNALKCYSRARDYCTSAKHVINMCLNVIKVKQHGTKHMLQLYFSYMALTSESRRLQLNLPSLVYICPPKGQCLPPELVSCLELRQQSRIHTRDRRGKEQ